MLCWKPCVYGKIYGYASGIVRYFFLLDMIAKPDRKKNSHKSRTLLSHSIWLGIVANRNSFSFRVCSNRENLYVRLRLLHCQNQIVLRLKSFFFELLPKCSHISIEPWSSIRFLCILHSYISTLLNFRESQKCSRVNFGDFGIVH